MRAIVMTAPGAPEVLQLAEVPQPTIESDRQILVQLKAAGVNPIDTKLRSRGTFYGDRFPAVLGCDGAGIVAEVGAAVTKFQVGDRVYFCNAGLGGHPGNYAEFATVDERFVAHKPKTLSFAEAAAAPLVLITAWEALCDRGRISSGMKTLIHAGAGGVGHVAIQIAKLKGAKVCTTVSTTEKADFVTSLGADQVIFYPQTDFVKKVLDWTDSQGVDLAFDTVGGKNFAQTFAAVKIYGDLVTILSPSADTNWKIARDRNLRISLELMLTPMLQGLNKLQQHQAQILAECAQHIDRGDLKIHLAQTLPLAAAADAHRLIEAGSMIGKIALEI
ncbi:NADPH:quinone reductase [Thalassoporum mexicanum PCC 7367]|uniref:zinc-dependent alcohol dehydrogenase family protein n=1 Tax=Thalassoporum mexicanum TaxID=3457544 RepID=UPI00029F9D64|nr:zinc-dependent alcohol dehydrogenase family protein [Pseudanabaena sp. PCC 7367]AFY69714.1 NADPH:quinone reductase [Pseudanabaena sp. PCC 7367]